jgi:hypothetical protein
MTSVCAEAGTVHIKAPDVSVVVPPLIPLTRIEAPVTGSPVEEFTTLPDIVLVVWAIEITAPARQKIKSRNGGKTFLRSLIMLLILASFMLWLKK